MGEKQTLRAAGLFSFNLNFEIMTETLIQHWELFVWAA